MESQNAGKSPKTLKTKYGKSPEVLKDRIAIGSSFSCKIPDFQGGKFKNHT